MTQKNRHNKCASAKKATESDKPSHQNERPYFSPAVMKLARANLKKYEEEADEAFLVRAEMDRKLDSLF